MNAKPNLDLNLFNMKIFLFLFIFITSVYSLSAQSVVYSTDWQKLQQMELKIKGYADDMINADHWFKRFEADSFFIRGFVQALKVNNSFSYPFDSLKTISILYPPDSSFRIFTWQMMKDFTFYRQKGAIQMKTLDGSLKLFPLFDVSSFTKAPNDSVRSVKNWIGAIYYKILTNNVGNKKVYTLLGFDENGPRSNKKWIDILTFDEKGVPQFGGNYFSFETDSLKKHIPIARYSVEYKKEARMRILYDKESQMIIYDHLISEQDEPQNLYTYIPDGSYEAFKWTNNKWLHILNLPTEKLGNGNAPLDNAVLDDNGNFNQKKLDDMSKKNMIIQQGQNNTDVKKDNKTKTKTPPTSAERIDY